MNSFDFYYFLLYAVFKEQGRSEFCHVTKLSLNGSLGKSIRSGLAPFGLSSVRIVSVWALPWSGLIRLRGFPVKNIRINQSSISAFSTQSYLSEWPFLVSQN